ncbi:HicB family protein [Streptomyces sp. 3213]|uniref:toxin-antitoxin system HicB family antitoxin n=1 Tax=Streptomyces sp. 3213.3 TaxID=1855348 RepID=UPI00089A5AF8|nr:toxin-antitoxin system HicB family antitoxin [Streptomyces sp. 3213.3]SED48577.1 HicB family protein [Streptomyces sp. 3213] [Streptomyces sp. 3213.3]
MIKLNLRLPDDLYAKAKALAATDDRSLNSWLVSLVRRTVQDSERRSAPEA